MTDVEITGGGSPLAMLDPKFAQRWLDYLMHGPPAQAMLKRDARVLATRSNGTTEIEFASQPVKDALAGLQKANQALNEYRAEFELNIETLGTTEDEKQYAELTARQAVLKRQIVPRHEGIAREAEQRLRQARSLEATEMVRQLNAKTADLERLALAGLLAAMTSNLRAMATYRTAQAWASHAGAGIAGQGRTINNALDLLQNEWRSPTQEGLARLVKSFRMRFGLGAPDG